MAAMLREMPVIQSDYGLFCNRGYWPFQSSQPQNGKNIGHPRRWCVKIEWYSAWSKLDLRSLDVLRNGFVDYGVRFHVAYFKPASGLNPDTTILYALNQLSVYRQVFYSHKIKTPVDVVLALNGIPVANRWSSKNQFTGQNIDNALKQYSTSRDNRELLFAFNKERWCTLP